MLLHHIAACALFFGFVLSNFMAVGTTIAWIHDIADIPAMAARLFSSVEKDWLAIPPFIAMVLSWFVTRLNWLPYIVFNILFNKESKYPDHLSHFNIFITLNGIYLSVSEQRVIFLVEFASELPASA